MFGFTDYEMDRYRDLAQDFAVNEITPSVVKQSTFVLPGYIVNGQTVVDKAYLDSLTSDIEKIITFTTSHMAYEYANMQCELDWAETDIINHLHHKFEDYLVIQFIKYGIGFTLDILSEIIGSIVLELPYLYVAIMDEDDEFDEDQFMEEKLGAYNEYMKNYMELDDEEELKGDEPDEL